jgi:hypothetical protein
MTRLANELLADALRATKRERVISDLALSPASRVHRKPLTMHPRPTEGFGPKIPSNGVSRELATWTA